jgi:hypothetical protein
MAEPIKWADVAHYYTNIPILVDGLQIHNGYHFYPSGKCKAYDIFEYQSGTVRSHETFQSVEYQPILRHLEDMSEEERDEFAAITLQSNGRYQDWTVELIHQRSGATHWLLSKGFDLFGLIESGQAIRKGVEG